MQVHAIQYKLYGASLLASSRSFEQEDGNIWSK